MKERINCRRDSCDGFVKKGATRYCSLRCQLEYQHEQFITKWLAGEIEGSMSTFDLPSAHIRRYIMERNNFECCICGWGERNPFTGRIPLHIDHIDGNGKNHWPENLRLLCPNHHALTATYAGANRGNGRPGRRARYLKGIKFSPLILRSSRNRREQAA